ncbi:hypothetical protein [Staphylococcus warneri]|uniref:hypothetical protein n=1 Tax=Staphylococcus warneri TaxID=1292 RepID=UPI001A8C3EE5|nr:hypothetical protein [Staphylococcus warneri]MBO0377052.1 hypothetical protein [Staphylococcus warneri]
MDITKSVEMETTTFEKSTKLQLRRDKYRIIIGILFTLNLVFTLLFDDKSIIGLIWSVVLIISSLIVIGIIVNSYIKEKKMINESKKKEFEMMDKKRCLFYYSNMIVTLDAVIGFSMICVVILKLVGLFI